MRCPNTLHFVAMFPADPTKHRHVKIMCRVSGYCKAVHFAEQKVMTDKVSVFRFYISMAKGKYHASLDKVLGCMTGSLLLADIGISLNCDFKAKGSAAENSIIKAKLKGEQAVAEGLWKFALAMYRWRAQSLAHYGMCFPGCSRCCSRRSKPRSRWGSTCARSLGRRIPRRRIELWGIWPTGAFSAALCSSTSCLSAKS